MHRAVPYSREALPRSLFLMILAVIAFALVARAAFVQNAGPRADEPFTYSFHVDGTLEESSDFSTSASDYWWLDSGGRLIIEEGIGTTIRGALPNDDRWRKLYAGSSPIDTSGGRHPQNLFRLLTQREWGNVSVSARFRVTQDNETASPNRNESNGLLLMLRYQDGDNLYYAGVRVDGHAVIKKKLKGEYVTLGEKPVFDGEYGGDNLLPREWLSLRSDIRTVGSAAEIRLYMKKDGEAEWTEILAASDASDPLLGKGHAGIRTDFMDVEFDDFRAEPI